MFTLSLIEHLRYTLSMKKELQRLSKVLSQRGICSRREADRFIEAGQISVNGEIISVLGTKVPEDADIKLLPKAEKTQSSKVTILLNKPIGYVSTQPEKNYPEALDLIRPENQFKKGKGTSFNPAILRKLAVAGRLDIDSKGLLILTQDGALAKKIVSEDSLVEKEYLVRVEGELKEQTLRKLMKGLSLDGDSLKPVKVEVLEEGLLRMTLVEGKKRQIRRMCELVKLHVVNLKRVRVGGIHLADLPEGKWRYLHPKESI